MSHIGSMDGGLTGLACGIPLGRRRSPLRVKYPMLAEPTDEDPCPLLPRTQTSEWPCSCCSLSSRPSDGARPCLKLPADFNPSLAYPLSTIH